MSLEENVRRIVMEPPLGETGTATEPLRLSRERQTNSEPRIESPEGVCTCSAVVTVLRSLGLRLEPRRILNLALVGFMCLVGPPNSAPSPSPCPYSITCKRRWGGCSKAAASGTSAVPQFNLSFVLPSSLQPSLELDLTPISLRPFDSTPCVSSNLTLSTSPIPSHWTMSIAPRRDCRIEKFSGGLLTLIAL